MAHDRIIYLGETDFRKRVRFGIKERDRAQHVYVIGKTGMGKSTLLENMAVQDIQNGSGLAFVDPHGKSADVLLDFIPESRIDDVLYFAPFDIERPISFNIMEDVGYDKRHFVVSGLLSAFKKIWVDAWSARMEYILSNTLLALLEYPDSTLLGVNRMYTDKTYRKRVIEHITDPVVKAFWTQEFAQYTDRYTQEATPAIQNKVGQFVSNPLIRNIIGQPKSSFDPRALLDTKKIVIVNLSKGRIGEINANLLGSMLIIKLYLAAMSRADTAQSDLEGLPPFYLYVDEFQSFANESFADVLSEARKYKLSLTMAHQYIEQMSEEVRAAVFGNVGTLATFRVGPYDAEVLEREFSPEFTAEDLVNLGFAQVYLRLMIDGVSSRPFSARTLPPIPPPTTSCRERAIAYSREHYARDRKEVEEVIVNWYGSPGGAPGAKQDRMADAEEEPVPSASENARKRRKKKNSKKSAPQAVEKDALPLAALKNRHEPTKQSSDELRRILDEAMSMKNVPKKEEETDSSKEKDTEAAARENHKQEAPDERRTGETRRDNGESERQREIPPDELRRMLEVRDNE